MKRTKQSARFDPYYKVQYYDPVSMTWRDIQRTHASPSEAESAYLPDYQCRTMEITMHGRRPLQN